VIGERSAVEDKKKDEHEEERCQEMTTRGSLLLFDTGETRPRTRERGQKGGGSKERESNSSIHKTGSSRLYSISQCHCYARDRKSRHEWIQTVYQPTPYHESNIKRQSLETRCVSISWPFALKTPPAFR
jgi:hypothetical protein